MEIIYDADDDDDILMLIILLYRNIKSLNYTVFALYELYDGYANVGL